MTTAEHAIQERLTLDRTRVPVDEECGQLSGPATKVILQRMLEHYGDTRFRRLAHISNGHIYNQRKRRAHPTRLLSPFTGSLRPSGRILHCNTAITPLLPLVQPAPHKTTCSTDC